MGRVKRKERREKCLLCCVPVKDDGFAKLRDSEQAEVVALSFQKQLCAL